MPSKKVTLTTPDAVGTITQEEVVQIELNTDTGMVAAVIVCKSAGGEVLSSRRFELTGLAQVDIDAFVNAVTVEAQAQSNMGAGTIS